MNSGKEVLPALAINKYTYEDAVYYYSNTTSLNSMGDLSGFVNAYSNVVGSLGQGVTDGNFSAFLLDKGEDDIFSYQQSMVAGANFQFNASSKPIVAKAIYNAVPLHAMPLSLNLMDNALLNYFTRSVLLHLFAILIVNYSSLLVII